VLFLSFFIVGGGVGFPPPNRFSIGEFPGTGLEDNSSTTTGKE
jgi:hypothetical protein